METTIVSETMDYSSTINNEFEDDDSTEMALPDSSVYVDFNAKMINLSIVPVLLVFGATGNILSFILMSRKALGKFSICVYLKFLAVFDTSALWVNGLWVVIYHGTDYRLYPSYYLYCVDYFGLVFLNQVTAWIVLAVTTERFIAVYFPYKAEKICTVRSAKIMCWLIIVISFSINSPALFMFRSGVLDAQKTCVMTETALAMVGKGKWLLWITTVSWSFIPASAMIVFNILMAIKLYLRSRQSIVQTPSSERTKKTAIILLTVSFTFAFLTLPFGVDFIIDPHPDAKIPYKAVITILLLLNNSINFVLYCCMSKLFRNELKKMLHIIPTTVAPSAT